MKHLTSSKAFTLIELVFVIVIMGILSKFGIEFLSQAYQSFIFTKVNNALQANSGSAVQTIASRLQYRIKDSIIAKRSDTNAFEGLGSANSNVYNVLEWVGYDIEGYRGDSAPNWSGIIDLDASLLLGTNTLVSPETNTTAINNLIGVLSHGSGTGINNAAIYFIGSDSNVNNYGWNGAGALADHNTSVMHRINSIPGAANINLLRSGIGGVSFSGSDVFEYYQLAWTAYAVVLSPDGNLTLHYDYQPWEGEAYDNAATKKDLIMQNVETFKFKSVGSVVKIQVCVNSTVISGSKDDQAGGYALCKEKTIY